MAEATESIFSKVILVDEDKELELLAGQGVEDKGIMDVPIKCRLDRTTPLIYKEKITLFRIVKEDDIYVIPTDIKKIFSNFQKLAASSDIDIIDQSLLSLFNDLRLQSEKLDLPDIITKLTVTPKDYRIPYVCLDQKTAAIYVSARFGKVPFAKKTNISESREVRLISFYLNLIIIIYPKTTFEKSPWALKAKLAKQITKDRAKLYTMTQGDIDGAKAFDDSNSGVLTIMAIFAILICSKNYKAQSTNKDAEVKIIQAWIEKRLPPLLIKLGYPQTLKLPNSFAYDLWYLSLFWSDKINYRRLYLLPFLSVQEQEDMSDMFSSMRAYVKMILAWSGMNTAKITHSFSLANSTHAHLLEEVVKESEALENAFDKLQKKYSAHNSDYEFKFSWLLHGQEESLEIRHYPNLAFCALYYTKSTNLNTSWDNYTTNIPTTLPKQTLQEHTSIELSSTFGTGALPDIVEKRLQAKHKKVDPADKTLFAGNTVVKGLS